MKNLKCPSCGGPLKNGELHCPYCGAELKEDEEDNEITKKLSHIGKNILGSIENISGSINKSTKNMKFKEDFNLILCIFLFVIFFPAGFIYLFSKMK